MVLILGTCCGNLEALKKDGVMDLLIVVVCCLHCCLMNLASDQVLFVAFGM